MANLAPDSTIATLAAHSAVKAALTTALAGYNADHTASSQRIGRALIMSQPPSLDANEITDKGYINQRAVIENRADLIAKLYCNDEGTMTIK